MITVPLPESMRRYSRQMLLPAIGVAGQARLSKARVVVIGVGALGTVLASGVVRAGVGYDGMIMPFIPGDGPCFRCMLPDLPAPGSTDTCDTAGVLGTIPQVIAALQVTEALKLLAGHPEALCRDLRYLDLWTADVVRLRLEKREQPCPACDEGRYEFLDAQAGSWATTLCGRDAVQGKVRGAPHLDLPRLAERLRAAGQVTFNEYLLRLRVDDYELTLFPDGRAIIYGCSDLTLARALYARYVGA